MTDNVLQAVQDQKPEMVEDKSSGNGANEHDLYNKDQVSKVVARERERAYEKGKREALMELQQQQQESNQQTAPASQMSQNAQPSSANTQTQQPSSFGGMNQSSAEQIQQMIADHLPQAMQDHVRSMQQKQTVDSFVSKMKAAESRHPGLEEKLNELDYSTIAPIIEMANTMENTADIMKELVDNPSKLGNMVGLLYSNQHKALANSMHNLSNSIKTNIDAAAKESSAQEPFGQLKPSTNAGMDNGSQQIADLRKQPWLRG